VVKNYPAFVDLKFRHEVVKASGASGITS